MLAEHRRRRKGSAGGAQTKQTNQMGNKNILEKRNQIKIVEDEHRVRRRRVRHGGGRTTVTERETMVLRKGVSEGVKKILRTLRRCPFNRQTTDYEERVGALLTLTMTSNGRE